METPRIVSQRPDGTPVYAYELVPGVPPAGVMKLLGREFPITPHAHDFLVLAYFERGGGSIRVENRESPIEAGDVYVIAPGEVVEVRNDVSDLAAVEGWAAFFTPDIFGSQAFGAFLSWRAHPLLFPFVRGTGSGIRRLRVPVADRDAWFDRFSMLDREFTQRKDGYDQAVLAHLTLLLVEVGRLAANSAENIRFSGDPLLTKVFGFIEHRYSEGISLRNVAQAVNLTPGHLTTLVRKRTGRPVQEWITERRLTAARRLLVETDLAIEEIGRMIGYDDAGYFVRIFRRSHGVTPLRWRGAGRL